MNAEKMPHPPTYTEIYPVVAENEANGPQMGWQHPPATEVVNNTMPVIVQPIQPPPYANQQPATVILQNQSRVGLYPVKLTPCPHCLRETKTEISFDSTLKTHLFALVLCLMCCWCCIPIPYITNNSTKTANHFCESCKSYIGSYDRNPCKW